MVGGLGLVLGQNFVRLLPTFISAIEKTFYLKWNGPENIILFHFENKKRAEWLIIRRDILAKQK